MSITRADARQSDRSRSDAGRPQGCLWLCEPEQSVGFAGLGAVAADHGLAVAVLDDPAAASAGDLVVSDPTRTPCDLVRHLPEAHHVALTHRRDEPFVLRTLRSGYLGFLLFTTPADEVGRALDRLLEGEAVVASSLASRVALSGARLGDADFWPGMTRGLTRRESEVLEGISRGGSTRAIAHELYVGEETVRSHLKSLYQKLGVSDRSAAVAHAFREGILSPDGD
jgi:DNA-binding NarL/FixJ family response regulator